MFYITKLFFDDQKLAFTAAALYLSMPLVLISSRNLTTDSYLTTFILASVYCWLLQLRFPRRCLALYLFYFFAGMAFLTKGPVGWLFIFIFILVYRIVLEKRWIFTYHHVLGSLLLLLVSGWWYLIIILENPSILDYFVEDQLVRRMVSNSYHRSKSFWYFLVLLPALVFPWFLFWVVRIRRPFRHLWPGRSHYGVLVLSAILVLITFSMFRTKLILYILPCFWMLAIATAYQFHHAKAWMLKTIQYIYFIIVLLFSMGSIVDLIFKGPLAIPPISLSLVVSCSIMLGILLFKVRWEAVKKTQVMVLLFGLLLLLESGIIMSRNEKAVHSIRTIAQFINQQPGSNKKLYVYNRLLSSAAFYVNGRVITVRDTHYTTDRDARFQQDEIWKQSFFDINLDSDKERLNQDLRAEDNKYLLLKSSDQENANFKPLLPFFQHRENFGEWVLYFK